MPKPKDPLNHEKKINQHKILTNLINIPENRGRVEPWKLLGRFDGSA
jgi:hypothetical protein